jgi:predicted outer membrane repeat protein
LRYLWFNENEASRILLAATVVWQNAAADVARIGTTTYPTLHAAVAAAPSNATIELIGDAILTNGLAISRPLAIVSDGSVRRIARTNAFADDVIYVPAAAALTLGDAAGTDAAPTLILDGGATNGVAGGYSFIFAVGANVVVHPGVVLRNYRGQYAALYMLDNDRLATLTLNGGLFTGNTATNSSGGAICSQGVDLRIQDAVFAGNAAPRGKGGAIYLEYATLVASNVHVHGNSADDYGGGLMAYPGAITLRGGVVSSNSAINGGGIANGYGNLTLEDAQVTSNSAIYGAAVWSHTGVNDFRSSTFRDNHADIFGGALYSTSSGYALSNCQIVANTAGSYGGGMYVSPATGLFSEVEIDSSVISSNSGLSGGGIYSIYATLAVAGSTLSHNLASGSGGALWLYGDTAIRDSRIADNVSSNEGGGILHQGGPLALSGQTRIEGKSARRAAASGATTAPTKAATPFSPSPAAFPSPSATTSCSTPTKTHPLGRHAHGAGTVAAITPSVYSNGLPLLRDGPGFHSLRSPATTPNSPRRPNPPVRPTGTSGPTAT